MRSVASRYAAQLQPAVAKQVRAKTAHISPPSKGLSLVAATNSTDPQYAGVLTNFYVDDDRIYSRAGYLKLSTCAGAAPIEQLIPYYGQVERLLAATNNTLCDVETGLVEKSGFTSNDWSWTAFSNLGDEDYTIMCNGQDGVWSWDGTAGGTGIVKEVLTNPTGNTWLDPNEFHIVLAHMNRLWFADQTNLAVYYLPLQQKAGELAVIPLNAIFKRGGHIKAMYTWTVDGGMGLDDQLVVFTTNGECAIYSGIDPDTDMGLVGVYRSDPPMSKHSVVQYGGELYVMLPTGVTPMTSMIKAGREGLEAVDRSVIPLFLRNSVAFRDYSGWSLFLNPSTGRLFCNMPLGGGRYDQMIRHMPKAVWSKFEDVPARCWGWINPYVYFGDDKGNIFRMHPQYQTDDGAPIKVDVQMAWNQFKTPSLKHFKMILPYIVTDGHPRPFVDVKVDYDMSPPTNWPEISDSEEGAATWDLATWDVDGWVAGSRNWTNWTGVAGLGRVGAVRLSAQVSNCSFAITGFDVLFEEGERVRMKVSFKPLTYEAIEILSLATGVDYTQTEFSNENEWFCVTVRRGADIGLIVAFEFKSWCDAHVTTVMLDHRCLTRKLLTAMIRSVFTRAARITAHIDPANEVALRQVWRMGFKYEGYLRRGIEGTRDAVVFGLLPEDCPYLSGEPFRFQRVTHDLQPGVH